MRMRSMAAVALVVLASTIWMGATQVLPSQAAPPNQLGMLRVGVHPGSCDDPQPVADFELNPLAPWEQENGPDATLFSYTETPAALPDLLATPHAIVVAIGGDVDAAIACGEIAGEESGTLAVNLEQENNSGFAGVALLSADDPGTRITVVLAEAMRAPVVTTPPPVIATPQGSAGTSPQGDATPTSSDLPGAETPTARPPAIIPVVTPPGRETPTAGTPSPSPTVETGESYTSETFGYAIAFSPPWVITGDPEVDATSDYIRFANGTSVIDFLGLAEGQTAPVCMNRLYESIRTLPGVRSIVSREGSATDELTTTPERAAEAWDISYRTETGQIIDSTLYLECLVLQPGESILVTTHEAPRDQYPAQAMLREEFYAGVTLPAGRSMR